MRMGRLELPSATKAHQYLNVNQLGEIPVSTMEVGDCEVGVEVP